MKRKGKCNASTVCFSHPVPGLKMFTNRIWKAVFLLGSFVVIDSKGIIWWHYGSGTKMMALN